MKLLFRIKVFFKKIALIYCCNMALRYHNKLKMLQGQKHQYYYAIGLNYLRMEKWLNRIEKLEKL